MFGGYLRLYGPCLLNEASQFEDRITCSIARTSSIRMAYESITTCWEVGDSAIVMHDMPARLCTRKFSLKCTRKQVLRRNPFKELLISLACSHLERVSFPNFAKICNV